MELPTNFSGRLRFARNAAKLSQGKLADEIGDAIISENTIGRLERGQTTTIAINVIGPLTKALTVSADWLFALDQLHGGSEGPLADLMTP